MHRRRAAGAGRLAVRDLAPGVFAVGDVRSGSVKRVASGVGEGSVVVQAIHRFLNPGRTDAAAWRRNRGGARTGRRQSRHADRQEGPDRESRQREGDDPGNGHGREDAQTLTSRLGPGLITGAADDDPSGIATYSQAGAQFGFGAAVDACS